MRVTNYSYCIPIGSALCKQPPARRLPSKYPGIKRVWTKNLKYQGQEGYKQAIVMEFESEDALKKYTDSAAQQWWYKIYLPLREESHTHDITN